MIIKPITCILVVFIFLSCGSNEATPDENSLDSGLNLQDSINNNLPVTDTPTRINRNDYLRRDTLYSQ